MMTLKTAFVIFFKHIVTGTTTDFAKESPIVRAPKRLDLGQPEGFASGTPSDCHTAVVPLHHRVGAIPNDELAKGIYGTLRIE